MTRQILLVEDEQDIADLLRIHLTKEYSSVTHASCGVQGMSLAMSQPWDLAILDRRLPGIDGVEICRALREKAPRTGIILLTAKDAEVDRLLGLELGADDYITKPFSVMELLARVRSVIRRSSLPLPESPERLVIGELVIDPESRDVKISGRSVALTALEFDLLWQFARAPGRVFRRADLLDSVWGASFDGFEHTVNSHINRLRSKIEHDPAQPQFITTVRGVGYQFCTAD